MKLQHTHYHARTKTFFTPGVCDWCKGTVMQGNAVGLEGKDIPKVKFQEELTARGITQWGEKDLPPECGHDDDLGCIVCDNCNGNHFYVDRIKNEYAIVKRPHDEFIDSKKSKKSALKLCDELNAKIRADNTGGTGNPAVETDLTKEEGDAKLGDTIVIRLAGDLDSTFKRGVHVELPVEKLSQFLTKLGVKPMAKNDKTLTAKDLIRGLIIKKKTDDQILTEVLRKIPDSNADKKHCTKYRRELFVEGQIGPELAAVGSREHREWAKGNMAAAKRGVHKEHWKEQEAKAKAAAAEKKAAAKAKAKPAPKKAPAKKAPARRKPAQPKAAAAAGDGLLD